MNMPRQVWMAYDANQIPTGEGYSRAEAIADAVARRTRRTGEAPARIAAWAKGLVCRVPAGEPDQGQAFLPGFESPLALVVPVAAPTLLPEPEVTMTQSFQLTLWPLPPIVPLPPARCAHPSCDATIERPAGRQPGGQVRLCPLHRRVRLWQARVHPELGVCWPQPRARTLDPELVAFCPAGSMDVVSMPRAKWFDLPTQTQRGTR